MAAAVCSLAPGVAPAAEPFSVSIRVDAGAPGRELEPIWRFFGADEPNYAYMENGRSLLGELGKLAPKDVYFRTHNLLCSGDGTPALKWGSTGVYSEDADGNPVYSWTILDRIFDTYLDSGVRPYAQIGFMPKALSIQPEPYQHDWKPGDDYNRIYTGWAHPPKDHAKWSELVYQWVKHCLDRYGREEVETWYWEVWNEPDIGYWQGKPRDETFHKLHDHAIAGVKRALPSARVGGPDSAYDGRFLRAFLEHCLRGTNHATGGKGTPLDFIAFHAKGAPRIVDGHVRMNMGQQLRAIGDSMRVVASFPELARTPIVIGESDPDGCAACRATEYPQYGYRNGSLFASYTAASFARKHELAERHGVHLEGALTWSFTFEDQALFAGMRTLATGGIDKPVLNVFRMFSKMSGRRLPVASDHAASLDEILRDGVRARPDVSALASIDGRRLGVLVWHYHDDDVSGDDARIALAVTGLPAAATTARLEHFRIDDDHSNAYTVWKRMGRPQSPDAKQYAELQRAGQLARAGEPETVPVKGGEATVRFILPRQGVSLFVLELEEAAVGK